MREILFRGKRKDNGEWVFGDLIHDPYGTVIQYYEDEINEKGNCAKTGSKKRIKVTVDPETVCQYTGLTDKNGRKIFEGDIVKIPLFNPDTMEIGFIEGAFCLVNSKKEYVADIHYIHHAEVNQTDIIGNIFDNPELIGDQP